MNSHLPLRGTLKLWVLETGLQLGRTLIWINNSIVFRESIPSAHHFQMGHAKQYLWSDEAYYMNSHLPLRDTLKLRVPEPCTLLR